MHLYIFIFAGMFLLDMLHLFVIDHADMHAVCVYFGSNSFFFVL